MIDEAHADAAADLRSTDHWPADTQQREFHGGPTTKQSGPPMMLAPHIA